MSSRDLRKILVRQEVETARKARTAGALAQAIMDLEAARCILSRVATSTGPDLGPKVGKVLRDLASITDEVGKAYRNNERPASHFECRVCGRRIHRDNGDGECCDTCKERTA